MDTEKYVQKLVCEAVERLKHKDWQKEYRNMGYLGALLCECADDVLNVIEQKQ